MDNLGQTTWNLTGVSPKRDWSSKGVNERPTYLPIVKTITRTWVEDGVTTLIIFVEAGRGVDL